MQDLDFKVDGSLSIVVRDENGLIKEERFVPNIVVNSGKEHIIKRMKSGGTDANPMTYMGLGGGTSPAHAEDPTLQAEFYADENGEKVGNYERVNMNGEDDIVYATNIDVRDAFVSEVKKSVSSGLKFKAEFIPENPNVDNVAITEAGIFDAETGGSMLCRTVFPVVTKMAADTITITWTISIQ
jgi:hypothetical protein